MGEWAKIFSTYEFHPKRRAVDLKDKWRNMQSSATSLVRKDTASKKGSKPEDLESIDDSF